MSDESLVPFDLLLEFVDTIIGSFFLWHIDQRRVWIKKPKIAEGFILIWIIG